MELNTKIQSLYEKDNNLAYKNLQELEKISETSNQLYPYLNEFISMLKSDKYVMRVRGFRLACKQAQWDDEKQINLAINEILAMVHDPKPTAIRQALLYLQELVYYKPELHPEIKDALSTIDFSQFKDTMAPLIKKDVQLLLQLIAAQ
ncbi:hypothetical protein M2139_001582 [Enterococcus sp. PF1-24]|uniref:hypothetical protein n=1 Tax=unclassified Enterococcus TaxID=2608891 RepID=UPI002475157B|nr:MULTISPECIES: hypothetical protein [unclassified Enterococcus]MDH6364595.1 hypothetical protein [Enterococcus sp. PFB1-1]MDH6401696.1 hypothetical protein [Enterococcus sp. PF1-24]